MYLGGIVFFKKHGDVSSKKTFIFCTLRKEQHKLKGDYNSCWCQPEKIVDISRRQHWFPRELASENRPQNYILMTRHYPDLGNASDRLKQISHGERPIRSTTPQQLQK